MLKWLVALIRVQIRVNKNQIREKWAKFVEDERLRQKDSGNWEEFSTILS